VLDSGTYSLGSYEDPDTLDTLTLEIEIDGSTDYPPWLAVSSETLLISPTSNEDVGSYSIKATVTDDDTAETGTIKSDSSTFTIEI
jgi:hypothetical protein